MERIIKLSELQQAVDHAYEQFKSLNEGEIDSRLDDVDPKAFGITVTLADGTTINKGDTKIQAPLGAIVKIPVASILLSQNAPQEIVKKAGQCACQCSGEKPAEKLSKGHKGIRAVSMIQPQGDPDSKWNFIENQMINLMGSAPQLDRKLYEGLNKAAAENNVEDALAKAGYFLYDNGEVSIDLYNRARSMKASTEQLAMMGATIAADGVNPATKQICYDGAISERIVGMMAAKGPHKMSAPWAMLAGLPAKSSFAGSMLGIFPGVMAIAAYAPAVNAKGISVKAAHAIMSIMNQLQISVFQSASLKIDTTK